MSPIRQNHLLRAVEEAMEAVRRIRLRRQEGDPAAAVRDAGVATEALLGPAAAVAARLDPATAAALLRDPEQVALWAALAAEQAESLSAAGRSGASMDAGHRALLLTMEAWLLDQEERRLAPALRTVLADAFGTACGLTDPASLTARDRALLNRVNEDLLGA